MSDRISNSNVLAELSSATIVDEDALNKWLTTIRKVLLQADVQLKMAKDIVTNIKEEIVNRDDTAGHDKGRILQQAVFKELCKIMNSGKPSFTPEKGKTSVVLFVGLEGSGITTTCAKYALYHKKRGWKPALVCPDESALYQLKHHATNAKVPFYGSKLDKSKPVTVAINGVKSFKSRGTRCDLIIVDSCGRNKQNTTKFAEMHEMYKAIKPDLVILVTDSSIGASAFDQALAFKEKVPVGSIIISKMDGHAKGGGALSAVVATNSPVVFIGTGTGMDELEVFNIKKFVSRLSGIPEVVQTE